MEFDSQKIDLPPSLTSDQIKEFPLANSISEGNLLTSTKIATAYNIPNNNGANIKVGIISLGGGFSQADLNKSMANLGLTTGNVTFFGVDGATNNYTGNINTADGENALDLVCIAGMVPNANIVVYKGLSSSVYFSSNVNYAKALNSNSSFGNAIQKAVDDNCDVISISWGIYEQRNISNVIQYCGDYLAGPLANAAAKNICVFVASGDYGSSTANRATTSAIGNIINVDYPSGNPNVTAVGGTFLTLGAGNVWISETVYNNSEVGLPTGFGGSGGVSSVINLPGYQANQSYKTYPGNTVSTLTSRGIPDISAAMNAYGIWLGNTVYGVSGTSASAPIMAGIVARYISLNGGRRPPGGSAGLNTIFYQNPGSFRDIQTGNNASLLPLGYAATLGWDAAVGLGPQANGVQTYQSVTSAGIRVKTNAGWQPVANVKVKTTANTWTTVNKVWVKTDTGWKQSY